MSDILDRQRRYCAEAPHDELACAVLSEMERLLAQVEKLTYGDPTEDELEADRVAIQRFQERLANDLRAAEERGRVTTRIEWRGHLRKAISRERDLRAENERLRALRVAVRAYLDALDIADCDPMHADEGAVLAAERAMGAALKEAE